MYKRAFYFTIPLGVLVGVIWLLGALPSGAAGETMLRSGSEPTITSTPEITPTNAPDLEVTFISRIPLYHAYCVDYPWDEARGIPGIPFLCPGTENEKRWPDSGEIVTFTAHVINKGNLLSSPVAYQWLIDGAVVYTGALPSILPAQEFTFQYAWVWEHTLDGERLLGDHTVGFVVDPLDELPENFESNNRVVDPTNAYSFILVITPVIYQVYNVPARPEFPASAEDWLKRQIAAMNDAFARAIYPTTPNGVTARVRIDSILVRPDYPNDERAHDGGWIIASDVRNDQGYYDFELDVDWGLVHELSHQVSLIDLYQSNVSVNSVHVLDRQGFPANLGFEWPHGGLMFGGSILPYTETHSYSSHTAGGMESNKGYRNGYYGAYQFDIPQQNFLRILDNQGNPAAGAQVTLYQRDQWDLIDNTPEISGTTDAQGVFALPNRSAQGGTTTATGHVMGDNPFGVIDIIGIENRFLVKLSNAEREEFHWLEVTAFNLAFWRGDTISHTFTISSHLPATGAPTPPQMLPPQVHYNTANLCWQASPGPGEIGYYVYRIAPPAYEYEQVSPLITRVCFEDSFYYNYYFDSRVYAVTAVDSQGKESGFSQFVYTPRLFSPWAISLAPDGRRLILDAFNFNPLIVQMQDGRYWHNLGKGWESPLGLSDLDASSDGKVLISQPGHDPQDRAFLYLFDLETESLAPLLEWEPDNPGTVEPSGVAWWGETTYSIAGPYGSDERTELLLHLDGSYDGEAGEGGNAAQTSFVPGKYGQGAHFGSQSWLAFQAAGNIERQKGSIEFWLLPGWQGNDHQNHAFFEIGREWFNRMLILKDGGDNLRFIVWDSSQEYGVGCYAGMWQAGEWRHIAATWQDHTLALYVDGVLCDKTSQANLPDHLDDTLYIGSNTWRDMNAGGVMDEFRISSEPRLGNYDQVRILVSDIASHRLLAYDGVGNLVTETGQQGSGAEEFDTPLDLAVNDAGNVIVADAGNSRLAVYFFDGKKFDLIRLIAGDFAKRIGVAAWRDRIVVADSAHDAVKIFDSFGNLLWTYTTPTDGHPGTFACPNGVAVEADGTIVVADLCNGRVVTIPNSRVNDYAVNLPLIVR